MADEVILKAVNLSQADFIILNIGYLHYLSQRDLDTLQRQLDNQQASLIYADLRDPQHLQGNQENVEYINDEDIVADLRNLLDLTGCLVIFYENEAQPQDIVDLQTFFNKMEFYAGGDIISINYIETNYKTVFSVTLATEEILN